MQYQVVQGNVGRFSPGEYIAREELGTQENIQRLIDVGVLTEVFSEDELQRTEEKKEKARIIERLNAENDRLDAENEQLREENAQLREAYAELEAKLSARSHENHDSNEGNPPENPNVSDEKPAKGEKEKK